MYTSLVWRLTRSDDLRSCGIQTFANSYKKLMKDFAGSYEKIIRHIVDHPDEACVVHCTGMGSSVYMRNYFADVNP